MEETPTVPKDVSLPPGVGQSDGGRPPPSPLSGGYLLIVISEPQTDAHKAVILQKLTKGKCALIKRIFDFQPIKLDVMTFSSDIVPLSTSKRTISSQRRNSFYHNEGRREPSNATLVSTENTRTHRCAVPYAWMTSKCRNFVSY